MIVQSPFYLSLDNIPKNINLTEFLLNETKQFGNDIALIDSESKWQCTYAQLPGYIARFQKVFEINGIQKGDNVAIIAMNYPEWVLSNLAIASLGGITVCINPLSTPYELTYFLNLADCKYAVVHKDFQQKVFGVQSECILMKNILVMPNVTEFDPQQLDLVIKGTSRCFIINFSSGTTGKPKAVESFHRSIVANIILTSQAPWMPAKTNQQERTLFVIPFYHGYGGIMVMHSLRNREMVVIMSRYKPKEFLQTLQDYKITAAFLVAPIIQYLATNPMVSNFDLSHFKSITSGASPLPPDVAKLCRKRLKLEDIRMIYGMSEIRTPTYLPYGCTNVSSIGQLLPNSILKVVNPKTGEQILQTGQVGELWFTGVQVLEGQYYKNEEANRTFYVREGDTVWTRTGDCGYFDCNGFVYLTDRYKDLIKYKGLQVSPSELEQFIRSHPEILDCAVVGRPDPEAGELPTAFVVAKENADIQKVESELKRLITEKLSSYKHLKGGIYFITEIPRSSSGKLSRASLFEKIKKNDSKL